VHGIGVGGDPSPLSWGFAFTSGIVSQSTEALQGLLLRKQSEHAGDEGDQAKSDRQQSQIK
jgi:hypothetical protein